MCVTLKVYLEKIHAFECQGITVSYNRESWSFPVPPHRTTQCMPWFLFDRASSIR